MAKTFLAGGIGHVRSPTTNDVMSGPSGARNSVKDAVVGGMMSSPSGARNSISGIVVGAMMSARVVFVSDMKSLFDFVSPG